MVKTYNIRKRKVFAYDENGNLFETENLNYLIEKPKQFFMVYQSEVEEFLELVKTVIDSKDKEISLSTTTIKIEKHCRKGYDAKNELCSLNDSYYLILRPNRKLVCRSEELEGIYNDFIELLKPVEKKSFKLSKKEKKE